MARAAGADNSMYFRQRVPISHAERILRQLETAHDNWNLLEMNGAPCAGRQISRLRWYDRPARQPKMKGETYE